MERKKAGQIKNGKKEINAGGREGERKSGNEKFGK